MKNLKYFILIGLSLFFACNKLDVKPDLSRIVPSTLEDFQGMLDNSAELFNIAFSGYGEIAANDFYVTDNDFQANFTPLTSSVYKWEIENMDDPYFSDWNAAYAKILNCNIVLDGLNEVNTVQSELYKNVKGQALFHRAHSFFMLVGEFAPEYSINNLKKPAIPLRTSSDINLKYGLSTVEEVYDFIFKDLELAASLLPDVPLYQTRPSKPAAFGLMARLFLIMGNYEKALIYSDLCWNLKSELLDYNLLDVASSFPISQFNKEVIFQGSMVYDYLLSRNVLKVQANLLQLYEPIDRRKELFFIDNKDGTFGYKGNYNGNDFNKFFAGIATDEILLIRAECQTRLNNVEMGLEILNSLLEKRYDNEYFVPILINSQEVLLQKILLERRKELLFRGLRWWDLRRLNQDANYKVTLIRELNGVKYTLPPNSPQFTFPIPKYVSSIQH